MVEKPFVWDEEFWNTLQKDSLFIQLGALLEIDIPMVKWNYEDSTANEDFEIRLALSRDLSMDIMQQSLDITTALYLRYTDDYSYQYPHKLLEIIRPELNHKSRNIDGGIASCYDARDTYFEILMYASRISDAGSRLTDNMSYNPLVIKYALIGYDPSVFGLLSDYTW